MAKKKSTGQKLLIGAVIVVGGVLVYKMISSTRLTPYVPPGSPPYSPPIVNPGSGGTLSNITSILDSLKSIFKGSGSATAPVTSGGGTAGPNLADYGITALAGRRRNMIR
jgi:hypothetical protein